MTAMGRPSKAEMRCGSPSRRPTGPALMVRMTFLRPSGELLFNIVNPDTFNDETGVVLFNVVKTNPETFKVPSIDVSLFNVVNPDTFNIKVGTRV